MAIMSDKWIESEANKSNIIVPFFPESRSKLDDGTDVPSYGLSSYGYDLRLGNSFKLFPTVNNFSDDKYTVVKKDNTRYHYFDFVGDKEIDPCNFDQGIVKNLVLEEDASYLLIPPKGFVLGVSMERLKIPRDVSVICMEKSTLARCGLCVTVTPAEPEWEGYLTLEISNKTMLPIRLIPGMGICQLQFFMGNEECRVSYKDRQGKYQNQPYEPVLPMRKI